MKRRHLDEAGVRRREARTTDVVDGKPALADGTVLDVTNIVWCTGYRQDFSFIHPSPVGDDGWPRDRGGVVPDLPGLYFMGLLFQRGFYSDAFRRGRAGRPVHRAAHPRRARRRGPEPGAGVAGKRSWRRRTPQAAQPEVGLRRVQWQVPRTSGRTSASPTSGCPSIS